MKKIMFKGHIKSLIRKGIGLGLITTFILSLSGCFLLPKEEVVIAPPLKEPPKITYEFVEAKKGIIERKITCTGVFVSVKQSDLSFKSRGGYLKKVYVELGDTVKPGDLLAEIDTGDMDRQIKLEEINLKKAQMLYDEKLELEENAVQNSKSEAQMAALDLEAQKLRLEALRSDYEKAKIYSPITGTVDYVLSIKEGQYIDAYKTLIRIADISNLQLQYSDEKMSDFQLGMDVEVDIDSKTYKGEVVGTPSNAPEDGDEEAKKSIRINVKDLPGSVKIGDNGLITLRLEKKENVIVLPKNLIHNLGSRIFVQVLENGIRKECDVELGIKTDTEVEIVKGLNVGDKIIK